MGIGYQHTMDDSNRGRATMIEVSDTEHNEHDKPREHVDENVTCDGHVVDESIFTTRSHQVYGGGHSPFYTLRTKCDKLVRSDHVDKSTGIEVLQIFHEIESTFLNLNRAFQRHIVRLRQEMQQVKSQNNC